jgi:hypothetical protein
LYARHHIGNGLGQVIRRGCRVTPSLIGYEPFFRARDALRIDLRVSLEDKDDSPD